MERFNEVIFDLGKVIALPLFVDKNLACKLIIDECFPIQIEMNEESNQLIAAATLFEIPPGKFREEVLKEALKANFEIRKDGYYLAYIESKSSLALIECVSPIKLTGEKLAKRLEHMIAYAKLWKEAIDNGKTAPNIKPIQSDGNDLPFGIKP